MRHVPTQIGAGLLLAATSSVALAQSPSATAIPVTIDNYNRAESDVYFGLNVKVGAASANSCIRVSRYPSTTRALSGPTATRCIRLRCSTSTPVR